MSPTPRRRQPRHRPDTPKTQPCPHCRQPTWTGPDAPRAGIPTTTDTTPLSRLGEALAQLDNRRTYEIDRNEIHYRDHWRINRQQFPNTVVAAHKCGKPTPPQWAKQQNPKQTPQENENPPF